MSLIYRFPLKMHVGMPCRPVVKTGDRVQRGQCIAEPEGLGARIHASISGEVVKISGSEISILHDGSDSKDYIRIKKCTSLLDTFKEAGIVGAGGAGFPTHAKFGSKADIEYIIANCVECEPLLKHNIRLLEQEAETVLKGLEYAMKASGAECGIIAVKKKNKKAIESIKNAIGGYRNIKIEELEDLYPMGEERAIINAVFGRWLEPFKLPLDAGCIVLNCETLANIKRAVDDGKPVIDKDVTVAGKLLNGEKYNIFLQVPVGTPVREIIDKCGGIDGKYGEIVIGGPFTGISGDLDKSIITKTTGGVIVTIELPEYRGKLGLLVCACGADEKRLREIAGKMGAEVSAAVSCKNVEMVRGAAKCKTPGT